MIHFGDYFPSLVTQFNASIFPNVQDILLMLAFPVLAFVLLIIFWPLWVNYVRAKNFFNMKYAVFEIKLPKETNKSPLAMELFLHALHNTSDGGWIKQFWGGETRPWYSLELVSVEGKVKFMIWCEDARKIGLMSALYAQVPGIEVHQVEDYTKGLKYDGKTMKVWAAEFEFTNKVAAYPIKTYVDYGLDKDPKEEFKVDPLVPGLEFLGSVGANQQIWIQLIVRAHKDEQRKPGHLFAKYDEWKAGAEAEIDKIMQRDPKTKVAGKKDKETGRVTPPTLSDAEKEKVEALSRSITKLPFDVGIRALYICKKEAFNTQFGIGGIISFFKAFNTENLNGFKPNGKRWTPSLDAPWKDYKDIRRDKFSNEGILAYKMRSYFYAPFNDYPPLVMNTEELATMYHFPGSVAGAPSLDRVASKKSEAPSNLPI